MKLLLNIMKFLLNFIYLFLKMFKTNNNKVTFISRQSSVKTLDFVCLENELLKQNKKLELVFLCKRFDNAKNHVISYFLYTIKTMYHIATSKVCVIDSYCLPVSILCHKKELKVIQIWHAMGAIKKFGYQTLDKKFGRNKVVATTLNMHKNYDLIISGSKEMTFYFADAFNYDKSYFLNIGLPRIDHLIKNKDNIRKKIYDKYPIFKEKIVVMYAPTFRKNNVDKVDDVINTFSCNDKYILIIKGHDNQILNFDKDKVMTCDEFQSIDLLTVTDYLITDYSAIAIEGASIDVKTLYYVYDYEDYIMENGLNIDLYKEMPGCVFSNIEKIYEIIDNNLYNTKVLKNYKNKYIDNKKGNSTILIVDKILEFLRSKK